MQEQRRNVMVGTFLLLGLAGLGYMIMLFGKAPEWLTGRDTWPLHIYFDEITDVHEGSTEVTLSGKRVGRVTTITFRDPKRPGAGVEVEVGVDREYELPLGTSAVIEPPAIGFGRAKIRLHVQDPDETQMLPTDGSAAIQGRTQSLLDTLIPPGTLDNTAAAVAQIGTLAEAMKPLAADLHHLMQVRTIAEVDAPASTQPANLYTAIQRLDRAIKHFNVVLGDPQNQQNVRESLANFRRLTEDAQGAVADLRAFAKDARFVAEGIREVTPQVRSMVEQANASVQRIADKIVSNADQLSTLLTRLDRAAADLADGSGTAGLLLRDNRLYESLVLTTQRLSEAVTEIKVLAETWTKDGVRLKSLP